jgi:NAD(P)-dependent dehydrogenase (short-subunit alcohol dehydrogenase family)
MTVDDAGTVLITGPTGGLGKAATLEMARRTGSGRPDLLLVGRRGQNLTEVAAEARAAGAKAYEIPCDLSRLSDVRAAALGVRDLLGTGAVRPLRGLGPGAASRPVAGCSALAQDLLAWCARLALPAGAARWEPKRLRLRILAVAGRLVRTARRHLLHIASPTTSARLPSCRSVGGAESGRSTLASSPCSRSPAAPSPRRGSSTRTRTRTRTSGADSPAQL